MIASELIFKKPDLEPLCHVKNQHNCYVILNIFNKYELYAPIEINSYNVKLIEYNIKNNIEFAFSKLAKITKLSQNYQNFYSSNSKKMQGSSSLKS